MDVLAGYTSSIFQEVESYLRKGFDIVENDNRLVEDEYNSKLLVYQLPPGIYILNHLSVVLLKNLQIKYEGVNNTVDFDSDDNSMKTKMVV